MEESLLSFEATHLGGLCYSSPRKLTHDLTVDSKTLWDLFLSAWNSSIRFSKIQQVPGPNFHRVTPPGAPGHQASRPLLPATSHLRDEERLQAAPVLRQQQGDVVVQLLPQVIGGQQHAQHGLQGLDDPQLHLPREPRTPSKAQ